MEKLKDFTADIRITAGDIQFLAELERDLAPKTCLYFESLLPYRSRFIHVRWSGEACWIPLGNDAMPFSFENATSYPVPGQMIFYPGGFSEAEILLAYGSVQFASKLGQLAGNHFLTIVEGNDNLATWATKPYGTAHRTFLSSVCRKRCSLRVTVPVCQPASPWE